MELKSKIREINDAFQLIMQKNKKLERALRKILFQIDRKETS